MDVKPAYRSLEGQSYGGIMSFCMYLLHGIFGTEKVDSPVEIAREAVGLAVSGQWIPTAQAAMIFIFMYFYSVKFAGDRKALKEKTDE